MMKVSRQRLSNQVYDILKDMIANHRFNPGTRINVEQITKEVGASRTPVWEAVHRLDPGGASGKHSEPWCFYGCPDPKTGN